jgi:Pilus formation protein N terminal region
MMTLCLGAQVTQSARHWLSVLLVLVLLVLATFAAPAIADEPIAVRLDQAAVLKLPERAATVIIGNPLIADVSIQPGGIAVVTGKGYGATNVIVMDHSGVVMLEKIVEVREPMGPIVVVYRGATRQTYSCTPGCVTRVTLGDSSKDDWDLGKDTALPLDYFNRALNQTVTRNNQALGSGSSH